jgi:hypothetical protein
MPSRINILLLTIYVNVFVLSLALAMPAFALDIWAAKDCPHLDKLNQGFLGRPQTESLSLWMAHGEWESFFVVLRGTSGANLTISVDEQTTSTPLDMEAFHVSFIPVRGKQRQIINVPDPLTPISLAKVQHFESDLTLFYFKLRLKKEYRSNIPFQLGLKFGYQEQYKNLIIFIKPVDLTLPEEMPLTIQAAWSPKFAKEFFGNHANLFEENKKALALLVHYRINAFAGVYFYDPLSEYEQMVDYCMNTLKIRQLRLASPTFKRVDSKKEVNLDKVERLIDKRLLLYQNLITHYPGRLNYKIWDEPHQRDFKDVVRLYKYAESKKQKIMLELSAPPVGTIKDIADIFVIRINDYEPTLVADAQKNGKQVWLYANPMHSLREPYYLMRNIGWLLWGWKLDGYHFWSVNNWTDNPWQEPAQKSNYFRKGVFVYPGDKRNCIFPSLRLELFREGLEDYLLLKIIDRKQNQEAAVFARDLFSKGFPFKQGNRIYSNDSRGYHDILLQIISGEKDNLKKVK